MEAGGTRWQAVTKADDSTLPLITLPVECTSRPAQHRHKACSAASCLGAASLSLETSCSDLGPVDLLVAQLAN